jgi:DNA-binding SARP family transcriptional activator/GGDEF domain-containing protein
MSENLPVLKVHILGGFSITYGDKPVSFGKNTTTKAMKLLQLLLYYGTNGIAREKLLEELYGREELADVANNLRVTVHRLKKMLVDAGLPQYDYIRIKKGIYQWNSPMKTELDTEVFNRLIESAGEEKDKRNKIAILKEACQIYGGDFLSEASGDDWVLLEGVQYKNAYTTALKTICEYQMAHGEYEDTLSMCEQACAMYPFDEWQAVRIECFIALKRYKEAMKEYEDTAQLFFEELGISPSDRMLEQFEMMSNSMNYNPQEIKQIKNRLREDDEERGAYYCSLPSFRDTYRFLARMLERNGQSAYLMLCSLTNGKGQPMENEEKLKTMTQELHHTIQHCLRRGDSFTKYSPSQFLVLLVGTDKENCEIIFDRVTKYFCREHKSWTQYLEFYVSTVADIERHDSKIKFEKEDETWS